MLRRIVLLLVIGAQLALPAAARKQKKVKAQEAVNFQLGLDYSHWLAGPVFYLATESERAAYLKLVADQEAEVFIRQFWKQRDPDPEMFGNEVRRLFDARAADADKRYRESATMGRRTARGAIYVVYGEPEEVIFDISTKRNEPDLEVWIYSRESEPGLDNRQPRLRYWFANRDGKVVEHTPKATRRNTIRQ